MRTKSRATDGLGVQHRVAADYTVRPTRGADNLFLISRASFSAHSPYAHLDGHHQESMHAKVKVLKPSPQTFLAGMHAQLRPISIGRLMVFLDFLDFLEVRQVTPRHTTSDWGPESSRQSCYVY